MKTQLREKLAAVRKQFDKEVKEREAAASKAAIQGLQQYFTENPSAEAYCAIIDVNGNSKVSQ